MDDMMNVTVGKLLEQVAEKYPDDEAVKFTDRDYRRTWREFNEEAETIAKGFLEMGIRKRRPCGNLGNQCAGMDADLFRLYQNRCGAGHGEYRL